MLFESDVITFVCNKLEERGFSIQQSLKPTQQGDDIIAVKNTNPQIKFYIEAKGETSSREGSNRYGQPFNSAQVHTHVSEAFYKACEVLCREKAGTLVKAGLAFPDNDLHRVFANRIEPIIRQLGLAVFWVKNNGHVLIDSPWEL